MALYSQALTYARQKAQTDSDGISDTNGLAWGADAGQDITRIMVERDLDAAQTKEAFATLSPSDNPPGIFSWPSDMYALKTVSVDWTGTGGQNFLQATPIDVANIQFVSFEYLRKNQPTTVPLFDNRGDTGEVFPTPAVNATIRIFYFKTFTEPTNITDTIPYPLSLDYRVVGDKIVTSYFESLGEKKANFAAKSEAKYLKRLNDIINILAPSSQQPIQPTPIQISGWQY
jgi:hypothetical protein